MIENTSAVGMINKMGSSTSDNCNKLVFKIWQFCIKNSIWLTAAHIPGCNNVVPDWESRNFCNQDTEWMLDPHILKSSLSDLQFKPDIDLFTSRLNNQFDVYCFFLYINLKSYNNRTWLQDDTTRRMRIHCNPVALTINMKHLTLTQKYYSINYKLRKEMK